MADLEWCDAKGWWIPKKDKKESTMTKPQEILDGFKGLTRHYMVELGEIPDREGYSISGSEDFMKFLITALEKNKHQESIPKAGEFREITWPTEAVKHDQGKARFDLIPPEFMFALAEILTFGANKYADRNWELGMPWGRVYAALMRHMWCWWAGKAPTAKSFLFGELDEETGKSHLWHAACCLCFLVTFEERASGTDDRFTAVKENTPNDTTKEK